MDFTEQQLIDVRQIPKPDRHPLIFTRYDQLPLGQSLRLLADHEPVNLRKEFTRDHPGTHRWQAAEQPDGLWQVVITKDASTPAPRIMANSQHLNADAASQDLNGAIWKLEPTQRQLDANIIALAAGAHIGEHIGPELDVILHVISGEGTLRTETETLTLSPADVVYLPARARRQFTAGAQGLRYLSVHQRKRTLGLMPTLRGEQGS